MHAASTKQAPARVVGRVPCHSVEFFVAVVMLVAILVILDIAYYSTGPMRIPGYGA